MLVVDVDGLLSALRHVTVFIAELFWKIKKLNKIKDLSKNLA